MLKVPASPPTRRPLLSERTLAWERTYERVAYKLAHEEGVRDALTPGAKLDIATTAANVAAQLVAGAELD